MSQLITVPSFEAVRGPLIFLAGPIQNAPDWQTQAIATINLMAPSLSVANPRCPPPWHGDFDLQVAWEHRHLERARLHGCVLFWLAKEESHDCARAYAQTTRFELGWHFWCHVRDGANLAIGIEPGFSNERYLRVTLAMYAPTLVIRNTLAATCADAAHLCGTSEF